MASKTQGVSNWQQSPLRFLLWGGAATLLLLPAVAMQFDVGVDWSVGDFIVMGALFAVCCGTVEFGARASASWAYRAGVGVAVLAGFLLIWINLAVGIIGPDDGDPINLIFAAAIAVAVAGAAIARGRPAGSARAMAAAALAQVAVAAIALVGDFGAGEPVWPWGFALLMGFFTFLWLSSAWLFRTAARAV